MQNFDSMNLLLINRNIYAFVLLRIVLMIAFLILCFKNSYAQAQVIMNHNDLQRTGWNNHETILSTDNVSNGNFGKIFSRDVDDQIYAQPLVMSNVSINGETHNIVLVATVNNTLYAFDADNPNASSAYWQDNLTYHSWDYRPVNAADMTGACSGNYNDFSGNMGIVGTPAIDASTNTLYVVSRSVTKTGTPVFVQYLHAIDISSGVEKFGGPVYITADYPGTGDGNVNGIITFEQQKQNQRPGLLLHNGIVYISWASHCDWNPYHGWVMGYDAATLEQKYVYNTTPNGGLGGIWMGGLAPSVDREGNIYVTTGNGSTGSDGDPNEISNRGSSLLKLSPDLQLLDFFTPMNYDYLNIKDKDYGINGALLIPDTHLSLSGSKDGGLFLIDNNNMGHTTTDNSNVLQRLNVGTPSDNTRHIFGSPAYYKDEYGNEYIYGWAEGAFLKQIPFDRSNMLFDIDNSKTGITALPGYLPGALLSISSNGSQHGTGILWASHNISGNANHQVVPGELQAFDATDITHELWNSNWSSKRDGTGNFAKFVFPTVANGKVYMASFSNKLNVYGLNPPAASSCSATLPPTWQSADIGYVAYPGDVCVENGTYTITSSGDDIWNTADAFHYVFQKVITNEVELTIRVKSIDYTDGDAKCGIMFRQSLDPGSPYVFLSLIPSDKIYFQQRSTQHENAESLGSALSETAPYWVRIYNTGNNYVSYISDNGDNWTEVGSVTLALGSNPYIGIAYSTHNNAVLGTAVVDHVSLKEAGVLSINLVNFNAKNVDEKKALLRWATSEEKNNKYFEIQRSGPSTDFETIGTVAGSGSPTQAKNYSFTDNFPMHGTNYYRIKIVDASGNSTYSPVAPVKFNLRKIIIYPNPAHDKIYIRNNTNFSKGDALNIQLLDLSGKVLYKQQKLAINGDNILIFNIPQKITTGMYLINVTNFKGEKQSSKVWISK